MIVLGIFTVILGILSLFFLWLFLFLVRKMASRSLIQFTLRFPLFVLFMFFAMIGGAELLGLPVVWRIVGLGCYLLVFGAIIINHTRLAMKNRS